MAKRKKTIGEKLDQIVEEAEKEPEELPRFSTDAEAGFVDDTKEENEKPDIREIARRAVIDKGVTNFLAFSVKIVLILAPLFFKDLIISKLLYAEIPPQIIISIFFSNKLFISLLFEY